MPKIPSISSKKFCKFLEHVGCIFQRMDGDHFVYTRPGLKRPIVFSKMKDMPVFMILNDLRTLGISKDEFIRSLKDL